MSIITCVPAYSLPTTSELLVAGGDERIALDEFSKVNRYGCQAVHRADLIGFGSSTANTISKSAFAAIDEVRERLVQQLRAHPPADVYGSEMQRVRQELLSMCGLEGKAELIFGASGTDIHMFAAQLIATASGSDLQVVMVNSQESGSGVPSALCSRHFGSYTALGDAVDKGARMRQKQHVEISHVAIRESDGTPRSASIIDTEVYAQVSAAMALGRQCLLVMTDVSKTGCIAPSTQCAVGMKQRWQNKLHVMVDACQFRLAPATLRAYLQQGFMMAVTGSKFVSGPTFSGALMLPSALAAHLQHHARLDGLRLYSLRQDWPAHWASATSLDSACNFGLLLRWEAALHELRAFYAIPQERVKYFMERFAKRMQERLASDLHFEALPSPILQRNGIGDENAWDRVQTIHSFMLHRVHADGSRTQLSRDETRDVYLRLQETEGRLPGAHVYQLGQPVECGSRNGMPVSALRISLSARLVAQALGGKDGDWGDSILEQAMVCCDEIIALTQSPAEA